MIQLKLITGDRAGTEYLVRQLPLTIGRAPSNALRLQESGVWDRHLEIRLNEEDSFELQVLSEAQATVNDHAIEGSAILSNGDCIGLGSLQLQFSLSSVTQKSLTLRETLTWIGLVVFSLTQIVIIYWLPS